MAVPLAAFIDVEMRLGRSLTDVETTRVVWLLNDVSAAVRAYCGREFTAGERTVRRRAPGGVIRLAEKPVSEVSSVKLTDGTDIGFSWDGLDIVRVWPAYSVDWFERNWTTPQALVVDVTYTAGPSSVPAVVKAVVCQMVGRLLGQPPDGTGVTQESVAGYSYTIGAAAAAGSAGMLADERRALDQFRRVGSTAVLG